MSVPAAKVPLTSLKSSKASKAVVLDYASNELIFAVVGHVGSGTSQVAESLKALLEKTSLPGGQFDTELLKARTVIAEWAQAQGKKVPDGSSLNDVEEFQNLGDAMRLGTGDDAAVARGLVRKIRSVRATKTNNKDAGDGPIPPDGTRRAYILDSIRHPAEVELLRHIYQNAFFLIGVVCEEQRRLQRVVKKYKGAGEQDALAFMRRDSKAKIKHGQRVSDAFHLADFFLDNTADQFRRDKTANPDWDINDKLWRLIKLITHSEIVRPELNETAMYYAYGAGMRSSCLSRQVGAALVDIGGNVVASGTNEVPRAGGGVYGEGFDVENEEDHRCAYRQVEGKAPFCSNTEEQNAITASLIAEIKTVVDVPASKQNELAHVIRDGRVGDLLEFSRAVHAEMDALVSAARKGVSTSGTRLFVTTFPCHYCARHIVSAGVDEVQYIEPYPKSQALGLHSDSIQTEASDWLPPSAMPTEEERKRKRNRKVLFRPFSGVAPRLYRRAFLKDRDLKDSYTGMQQIGEPDWGSPWHLRRMSYIQLEAELSKEG